MKSLAKLALISIFAAFSTSAVFANIYRIDFTYGPDTGDGATGSEFEGVAGSLTGYMVIDESLDTGNARNDDSQGFKNLGGSNSWITEISLTFDPDNNAATTNSVTKTRSDLQYVLWNLSGGDNSFNVMNDFSTMFTDT